MVLGIGSQLKHMNAASGSALRDQTATYKISLGRGKLASGKLVRYQDLAGRFVASLQPPLSTQYAAEFISPASRVDDLYPERRVNGNPVKSASSGRMSSPPGSRHRQSHNHHQADCDREFPRGECHHAK